MTPAVAAAAEWAAGIAVWTALIFAAARIADRLLAERVAARARMLLYAALLVRLALPLRWEGGVAGEVTTQAVRAAAHAAAGVVAPAVYAAIPGVEAPVGPSIAIVSVYAAGLVVLATVRLLAARRLSRGLRPARESLRQLAPGDRVFESDGVGPAVVGVLRPAIVLPSRLADTLDTDSLAWIVRHERAHLAARDPLLLGMLQALVLLLWPLVPLWFALRRVRTLMELACDDRTLAGSPETGRRDYMRALLEVVDRGSFGVRGGALGFGNAAAERLRALAAHRARWPRVVQGACVLTVAAALVACATARGAPSRQGADYLLVQVTRLPGAEATQTGDDGVERPVGVHVVTARLFAARPGEPFVLRSSGLIEMHNTTAVFDERGTSFAASAEGPHWVRLGGEATVNGAEIVAAPTLIAFDGNRSSISLRWNEGAADAQSCEASFTVVPEQDGLLGLDLSFEQREGGRLVRDVPATTLRVHEGDTYLVGTRRSGADAK